MSARLFVTSPLCHSEPYHSNASTNNQQQHSVLTHSHVSFLLNTQRDAILVMYAQCQIFEIPSCSATVRKHIQYTLPLLPAGRAEPTELLIYKLECWVDGASAFVDLSALYKAVMPQDTKLTASEWVHTWYKWWEKSLVSHQMPASHLRKALPTKASGQNPAETRIFQHPTCSLNACLLLLVRFAAPSRGGKQKDERLRSIWLNVLEGLVRVLQPQAGHSFKFFTDALTSSCPNLPRTGAGLVTLDWLTDGRVNLEPLLHSAGRLSVEFAATWQGDAHVGLTDLLLELQSAGKRSHWLLTQLFYELGAIFAAYLESATRSSGDMPDQSDVPGESRGTTTLCEVPPVEVLSRRLGVHQRKVQKARRRMQVREFTDVSRERTVCRHLLAARRHAQNVQHMSVAFDASR
eukprot:6492267-Amphidinium_carterae.3